MLLEIKNIKEFKLDRARKELKKIIDEISKLRDAYNAVVNELEEHVIWRQNFEDRLYADIEQTLMKVDSLDEIRQMVAKLHEKDATLRQNIMDLEFQIEQAITKRKECLAEANRAARNVEKYQELLRQASKKSFTNEERRAENLLDEFLNNKHLGDAREHL